MADDALFRKWEDCNSAFHTALVSECGSSWLIMLRAMLHEQAERYRWLSMNAVPTTSRTVHTEHEAIYEAAMARDVPRAKEALRAHLTTTLKRVARTFTAPADAPLPGASLQLASRA